jgi:hypothetical protein
VRRRSDFAIRRHHKLNFIGTRETHQQQNFRFWPSYLTDFAAFARDQRTHEIRCPSFVLALITIAFEVHSDAALTSDEISRAAVPDPVTVAIAHGLKHS